MSATTAMRYHAARARALFRELDANPDILLLGSAVSGPFNPDMGLDERYADRILWPPIAEFAAMGIATGASMAGLRTLVPISTSSFMFYGWPAIVQEASNVRYLSAGRASAPVVFHVHAGHRRGGGAQHEHTPHAMLQNVPGLRILAPGTPAEVDAAFHEALTGGDPTLIVDHLLLADAEGPVPDAPMRLGEPNVVRSGRGDLAIVSYSLMLQHALEAATALEADGVSATVVGVPCLSPMPVDATLDAIAGHASVLFVDESRAAGSPASHLAAGLLERGTGVRARLLCTADAHPPFAPHLLDAIVPTVERIAGAARELLGLASATTDLHRPSPTSR